MWIVTKICTWDVYLKWIIVCDGISWWMEGDWVIFDPHNYGKWEIM